MCVYLLMCHAGVEGFILVDVDKGVEETCVYLLMCCVIQVWKASNLQRVSMHGDSSSGSETDS